MFHALDLVSFRFLVFHALALGSMRLDYLVILSSDSFIVGQEISLQQSFFQFYLPKVLIGRGKSRV